MGISPLKYTTYEHGSIWHIPNRVMGAITMAYKKSRSLKYTFRIVRKEVRRLAKLYKTRYIMKLKYILLSRISTFKTTKTALITKCR